jgi:hypothetical protein
MVFSIKGINMVPGERDFSVNAKVSSEAARRLKQISVKRNLSYGEILDELIMGVPLPAADWEQPLVDALSRITTLENQVAALLSGSTTIANTETLPSLLTVAKQDTSGLDEPELACLTDVKASALEGDLSASEAQGIDEPRDAGITAESAPQEARGGMEKESLPPSILPEQSPTKRSVKEFIAGLVANGERSPQAIARALNDAGYRTQARTEFLRSNPQIKKLLEEAKVLDAAKENGDAQEKG